MLKCVLKCSTTAERTFENRGHWHCPYCFQICERKNATKIVENQPGPYSYPSLNLVAFFFREDNYWCSTPSFGPDWKSVWKKGKIFHHCENPRYILYVSNLYYTCWARTRRKADQRKKNFWMFQILKRLDLSNAKHSYSLFSRNAGEFSNYMHK